MTFLTIRKTFAESHLVVVTACTTEFRFGLLVHCHGRCAHLSACRCVTRIAIQKRMF